MINYYEILQVQPNADSKVIEASARALLRKCHPDHGGDKSVAASINDAKKILLDPKKRADFDRELSGLNEKRIGPYKVIEKLAEGGFGVVYKAKHVILDEWVVIKHNLKISPAHVELLKKEARAIWDLRHHAIPAIRDFIMLPDNSCCLVMSYIEGPTLQEVADKFRAKNKQIDPENAAWILERILDALRYVHYHGVIHGDIKPLNIIVQPERHTCYLVDFGLASIRPDMRSKPEGYTMYYSPPEVMNAIVDGDGKPLLPESDLYSLGVVAIYLFGGDPETKKIPKSVPTPIRSFIASLLAYNVNNRPNWQKTDIFQDFRKIREEAFGRANTNFKKLEIPE